MDSVDLNWRNFVEKGDESSFSAIYYNHVDDLYSYGVGLGFDHEMSKDAIQDTFYKLYISKESLYDIKNITAYIFKSFKYRLIDLFRKRVKEESLDSITDSFTIDVSVLDNMVERETADILKSKVSSFLSGLAPNQREVVYLKYMIGLDHKEIASILDIREDSSRKLLYRAMEKLRSQVSEEDFQGILF